MLSELYYNFGSFINVRKIRFEREFESGYSDRNRIPFIKIRIRIHFRNVDPNPANTPGSALLVYMT